MADGKPKVNHDAPELETEQDSKRPKYEVKSGHVTFVELPTRARCRRSAAPTRHRR